VRRLAVFPASLFIALALAASSHAATRCGPAKAKTLSYKEVEGVDRNLTSLDLYMPSSSCRRGRKAPVVIWVHGGGYATGDKKNQIGDKVKLFNSKGWALVSTNYRLTKAASPRPWRWPTHFEDVSAAISWVYRSISARGGDRSRIALLGHSAGADIVSNLATNPDYLVSYRLSPRNLRCQGPLDTEGFNKPASADPEKATWENALGNAPDYLRTTSATLIARTGVGTPKAIVAVRGSRVRQEMQRAYLGRLKTIGAGSGTAIAAQSLTHMQVNSQIGAPGDKVMTPPLMKFLGSCLR
jgi:acetyl esterase/lipase